MAKSILILGDGGWGTALGILLAGNGHQVRLWSAFPDYASVLNRTRLNGKFLPGVRIPDEIEISSDMPKLVDGIDLLLMVYPAQYMRGVLEQLAEVGCPDVPIVSATKGIENSTLMRGSQMIRDVLGKVRLAILSGPSHAEEVARQTPTTVVASSSDAKLAKQVQSLLMAKHFRVYTNSDVIGVELGGALKNVMALAAGICDGLELGDNAKAALMTRGLTEMSRLGTAMGARKATFFGLSGMGDLITTCYSGFGRNRAVGEAIGKGRSLKEITGSTEQVAEGVATTKSVHKLAEKHGVEMPITEEVFKVLFKNKKPLKAVSDLMLRGPKEEIEELK